MVLLFTVLAIDSSLYILYTSIACLDMYFFPLFFYFIYFKPVIDASFGLVVLGPSDSESRINVLTLTESVLLSLKKVYIRYPAADALVLAVGFRVIM